VKTKLNSKKFIEDWNIKYPYDRWWRKKYNIPFGSKLHREQSHVDMVLEYREDQYFKSLSDQAVTKEEFEDQEKILISKITALKAEKIAKKESSKISDKEFDELDISQFND